MKYCDQHPEEIDKLAKVKAQVTEVKGVMMQNIEKVCLFYSHLDNGYRNLKGVNSIIHQCSLFPIM
jgi:hypothetical protein